MTWWISLVLKTLSKMFEFFVIFDMFCGLVGRKFKIKRQLLKNRFGTLRDALALHSCPIKAPFAVRSFDDDFIALF